MTGWKDELFERYRHMFGRGGYPTVGDGWRYFVHGWSHVVALAFGLAPEAATAAKLLAAADAARPPP